MSQSLQRIPIIYPFNLLTIFLAFIFLVVSCSPNESIDGINEPNAVISTSESTALKAMNNWEEQVTLLTQKMTRFKNHQVALAQGWDEDLTGYVSNMGHHFANWDKIDGEFNLLEPEALLYIPGDDGKMEFVGVEYLVLMELMDDPSTPPEGFIGDTDVWAIVGPFWTLHAWVGKKNPNGVFSAMNPDVD
ncbi:hypothetical protein [Aegicerativicinus sediminis]|uniref:hypothetical protein n=1 Tax=Aegicerativicinus sediminis TaxID=2893202 RepID=UPI001E2D6AC2|nr:hypothetical protein [Aegicerativicinus sediminis]